MHNSLGSTIKSKRKELCLSVRDLAKLANINHTDVSKLEQNRIQKPSINMLLSLSKALNCNLLAAYLESDEKYLYYQPIIESCSELNKEQQESVLRYIQQIKDRGLL